MILIENLYKNFGPKEVLKGINLTIPENQTICIIGKSGCGKSVLLKHIVGLIYPDKGSVSVDGKVISNLSKNELFELRKDMGFVFQGSALFDSYNVYENVVIGLSEHGVKDISILENEAKRALSAVGLLPDYEQVNSQDYSKEWEILKVKKPSDLSGGMKKRVGVARALVGEKKYIFYDEPTTGLDPVTSEQIDDLILNLSKKFKLTSIVITHDMFSVFRIADKVAMIDSGQLIFNGTTEEFNNSDNETILEFIDRYNK